MKSFLALSFVLLSSILLAQAPVPAINQPLVPTSIAPGSAAFTLRVNGTGFVSGSVVHWNGSSRTTTFVNADEVTAHISAADVATASTAQITVVNPGVASASNIVDFPITPVISPVTMIRQDYFIGNSPACVAVGDFNGDGIQDLAVGTFGIQGGSYVSVLFGNGDGTFQTPATYTVGAAPIAIVTGDFNGDGKLDIATGNSNDGTVSVLLNNGNGTFKPQLNYKVGSFFTEGIAAGDFNHDGKLDIVATNSSDNSLGVLIGNGDGTFQPVVTYPVGTLPFTVLTADFNKDGNLDLAVVNANASSVSILLGRGDGTFNAHVDYPVAAFPLGLVAADFNGDGILDLASVSDDTNGTLSILLGKGDGTFTSGFSSITLDQAQAIVAGDFNGDGKLDVAIQTFNCPVSCSTSSLVLLNGNGDGTFEAPLSFTATNLGASLATGDFNNDGKLDFVIGVYYGGEDNITTLLQTPAVSVSPLILAFGNQTVNTTSPPQNVTLSNNTANTITITAITASGDFGQTNTCGTLPARLAPGGSCTIAVTFTPAVEGALSGSITITDNGGTGTQTIRASGTGIEAIATLSKTHVSFPPQAIGTTSAPQVVRLTNTGNATLNITSIASTGDSGNFNETNTCPPTLGAGGSCHISITFSPQAKGTLRGAITITDNASPPTQTISLVGTGK